MGATEVPAHLCDQSAFDLRIECANGPSTQWINWRSAWRVRAFEWLRPPSDFAFRLEDSWHL